MAKKESSRNKCEETANSLYAIWIAQWQAAQKKDANESGRLSIEWELLRGELNKNCSDAQHILDGIWKRFRDATFKV